MKGLISAELLKLRKRILNKVLLGMLLAPSVFLFGRTVLQISSGSPEEVEAFLRFWQWSTGTGELGLLVMLSGLLGAILAVMIGAIAMGSEYAFGTVRMMLLRARSRNMFLLTKMAALLLSILFAVAILALLIFAEIGLASLICGQSINWPKFAEIFLSARLAAFGLLALVLVVNGFLGLAMATMTRSTIGGVVGSVLYYFLDYAIAQVFQMWDPPTLYKSINLLTQAIMAPSSWISQFPTNLMSAVVSVILYCVLFAGIALYVFNRRDVTT
jgi:ABC-2 type transport system permease protein